MRGWEARSAPTSRVSAMNGLLVWPIIKHPVSRFQRAAADTAHFPSFGGIPLFCAFSRPGQPKGSLITARTVAASCLSWQGQIFKGMRERRKVSTCFYRLYAQFERKGSSVSPILKAVLPRGVVGALEIKGGRAASWASWKDILGSNQRELEDKSSGIACLCVPLPLSLSSRWFHLRD